MNKVYVIGVIHKNDGLVLLEVFNNEADALEYSLDKNLYKVLSQEYGEEMANSLKDECTRFYSQKDIMVMSENV